MTTKTKVTPAIERGGLFDRLDVQLAIIASQAQRLRMVWQKLPADERDSVLSDLYDGTKDAENAVRQLSIIAG